MSDLPEYTDKQLIELLRSDKDQAIEHIFRVHYSFVSKLLYRMVPDIPRAEDLAQDVFMDLWRKRDQIQITSSIKSYLHRAAINKGLNFIRGKKMQIDDVDDFHDLKTEEANVQVSLEAGELEKAIQKGIDQLPERCRQVFILSRFEEMSYKEIATHLNISVKTVENQISKALKFMRKIIDAYQTKGWVIALFFLLNQ